MKEDLLQYDQGEISLILTELDRAISSNQKWLNDFHRGLISKESIPEEFMQDHAYSKTMFGQWLYNSEHSLLQSNAGVQNIEECYRLLHEEARKLAVAHHENLDIPIDGYNEFIKHLSQYQIKVTSFRDALIETKGVFDPLTGLMGRQTLMLQLSKEHSLVSRGLHECAIVMIDIDHFKAVNDNYGHQSGDTALCYLAQCIRLHLRPYDSPFRYGGEEFLVCLPNINRKNAFLVMDRMRKEIESMPIDLSENREIHMTVSIGIAMMEADTSAETTIAKADAALYSAKDNGRNKVVMAEGSVIQTDIEDSA
ncbi:MAG: diguanylate cyclase [Mariprofundaceae bacterium]